jgi:hypothetical protein
MITVIILIVAIFMWLGWYMFKNSDIDSTPMPDIFIPKPPKIVTKPPFKKRTWTKTKKKKQ